MNPTDLLEGPPRNAPDAKLPNRFRNRILQNLPQDAIDRLDLIAVPLPSNREIEFTGKEIGNLFFIESGIGSMTMTFTDGPQVEVGLFGFEAAIGVSALMGTKRSLHRIFMQVGGHGYKTRVTNAREEFGRCGPFQQLVLRYVQAQLDQSTISTACNLRHRVSQRLARWLLLCADRAQENVFELSQDFLGVMLGTRRTTITLEMNRLVDAGILVNRRRRIEILDRKGLEARACECYGILSAYLNDAGKYDAGFVI